VGLRAAGVEVDDALRDNARFDRAELRASRMSNAHAAGVSFADAAVLGGDWHALDAPRANFDGALLDLVLLFDGVLTGSTFRKSRLSHCSLMDAKLAGCVFHATHLEDCDLTGADTTGASFHAIRGYAAT